MRIYCLISALLSCFLAVKCISIEVFDVMECDKAVDGEVKFTSNFDKDAKTFDITLLEVPFDIEGDDEFHMDVHELEEDKWTMYKKEIDGDICSYVKQFMLKGWDKMRSALNPEVSDECSLPQGKYELTDFQLGPDDVSVPSGMIGRFRLDVSLIRNDDAVFCKGIDLEVKS